MMAAEHNERKKISSCLSIILSLAKLGCSRKSKSYLSICRNWSIFINCIILGMNSPLQKIRENNNNSSYPWQIINLGKYTSYKHLALTTHSTVHRHIKTKYTSQKNSLQFENLWHKSMTICQFVPKDQQVGWVVELMSVLVKLPSLTTQVSLAVLHTRCYLKHSQFYENI